MVDSGDLKSPGHYGRAGSSPAPGTMNLRSLARSLKQRLDPHEPLITVSISRDNLLHNLHTYQAQYPDLKFAPVLKSNAYGHGLTTIATLLDREDIAFFMVDSYFEARALRRHGIRSRIVIMGYVPPEEILRNDLPNTDYAVTALEQLETLAKDATQPIRLHIKLDTGMHRQGIVPADLASALDLLKRNSCLELVGVASHFADADNPNPKNTLGQIDVWNTASAAVAHAFPHLEYRHLAATKGVPMSTKANANVARLGIGLYGFDTSPEGTTDLTPVMEVRTRISSIRTVPAGDFVGYNATYTAPSERRVATLPLGYYEGLDRRLSNKGSVLVRGVACPIVGRVSMNISSIDVSAVPDAKPGDEVIIISRNSSDPNSIENSAKLVSTPDYTETPYVILTQIPAHLKRIIEQ